MREPKKSLFYNIEKAITWCYSDILVENVSYMSSFLILNTDLWLLYLLMMDLLKRFTRINCACYKVNSH